MLIGGASIWGYNIEILLDRRSTTGREINRLDDIDDRTWRELFVNTEFVDFAWKYARSVSHSKKEILDKIKDDPSNFFQYVTPSDLAWALLVYFNNKKKWEADILKKTAVSTKEGGTKGGGEVLRGRRGRRSEQRMETRRKICLV